jgi:hypothetical protein
VWIVISLQKREGMTLSKLTAYPSASSLSKKHRSMNILLPISWIRTQKEPSVSCTYFLELGQPIVTKL